MAGERIRKRTFGAGDDDWLGIHNRQKAGDAQQPATDPYADPGADEQAAVVPAQAAQETVGTEQAGPAESSSRVLSPRFFTLAGVILALSCAAGFTLAWATRPQAPEVEVSLPEVVESPEGAPQGGAHLPPALPETAGEAAG